MNSNSRKVASLINEDCKITMLSISGGTHSNLLTLKQVLSQKGYDVSGLRPDTNAFPSWPEADKQEWAQTHEKSDEYGEGEDSSGQYGYNGQKGVVVQIDREYRFRTMGLQQSGGPGPQTFSERLLDAWNTAKLKREERKDIKQAKARAKKEGVSYEYTKIWAWKNARSPILELTKDSHSKITDNDLNELFQSYPSCKH